MTTLTATVTALVRADDDDALATTTDELTAQLAEMVASIAEPHPAPTAEQVAEHAHYLEHTPDQIEWVMPGLRFLELAITWDETTGTPVGL
ncbi:hypothetical protein [Mycetocola reblochoni]|uniref:hypothetical protein n=1 Tax=Mycetocola reblochoni TaxID=331618 RepID=UPI003F9D013D